MAERTSRTTITRTDPDWSKRRDIPLAVLAWIGLIAVIVWLLSYIDKSLLLFAIAAFFAYALSPTVAFMERFLPRLLAVLLVYVVVLSGLGILMYFVVTSAVVQFSSLAHTFATLTTPKTPGQETPLTQAIQRFGISHQQIDIAARQLTAQAEQLTGSIVPFLRSIFSLAVDMVLVAIVSIYLLIDGKRIIAWMNTNMPVGQKDRVTFFLATLERVVGGYIKGQVLLAGLIGLLVGVGMTLFHVPYAILLGVIAFVLEFIPIIGVFISGAVCTLLALTQGWTIAVIVVGYFIGIHVLEGDIIGPRVVGKALGLHPLVSLMALLIGTELFGISGALFAAPVAGVLQTILVALYTQWRAVHPEMFILPAKLRRKK